MPLTTATLNLASQFSVPKTIGTFASYAIQLIFGGSVSFASGAGANQAAQVYTASRTVTSGTPDLIDLTAGTLLQPDGSTFTATDVVAFGIKNNGVAGQILTVGSGTNPVTSIWTTTLTIPPGAVVVITNPAASGYALNNSTAHVIQVTVAAGTSVPYDVFALSH